MIPLQVELQRVVKATKDEAMTVEQAAEYFESTSRLHTGACGKVRRSENDR